MSHAPLNGCLIGKPPRSFNRYGQRPARTVELTKFALLITVFAIFAVFLRSTFQVKITGTERRGTDTSPVAV